MLSTCKTPDYWLHGVGGRARKGYKGVRARPISGIFSNPMLLSIILPCRYLDPPDTPILVYAARILGLQGTHCGYLREVAMINWFRV